MNRLGWIALVTTLWAAAFSSSFLGCGGDDASATGAGGATDATGAGAGGATSGSGMTAGSAGTRNGGSAGITGFGGTSGGSGGTMAGGGNGGTHNDDASVRTDAASDSGRADASLDVADAAVDTRQDAGRDTLGERDAGVERGPEEAGSPDAGSSESATSEGGTVEATAPEASSSDANAEGDVSNGCDLNTIECLKTRDKVGSLDKCSQCIVDNGCLDTNQMGGSCEDTPGSAPASCATALGSSSSLTETQVCLRTLDRIFSSGCAATSQLVPCLCGSADAERCLAGTETPTGPLFSVYQCELGTTAAEISGNFQSHMLGTGQANAIAQCAGAFSCDCF